MVYQYEFAISATKIRSQLRRNNQDNKGAMNTTVYYYTPSTSSCIRDIQRYIEVLSSSLSSRIEQGLVLWTQKP